MWMSLMCAMSSMTTHGGRRHGPSDSCRPGPARWRVTFDLWHPAGAARRMKSMGGVEIIDRERVRAADRAWLRRAIELSRSCPSVSTAYNVGAVIVYGGMAVAEGYSRDTDGSVHAEESAL